MRKSNASRAHMKVFYRPIEAAIHWSDLSRLEHRILRLVNVDELPERADIPRWSELRLNLDRIRDALVNGDLCYGKNGITLDDSTLLDDPDLTVRHVDLKAWILRFYPDQRPSFLFDDLERHLHPAISIDAVQALMADREALKVQLAERLKACDAIQNELQVLSAAYAAHAANKKQSDALGPRSEGTYLNIVGGLLMLLLGKSPSGIPYSAFETLDSVISALVAHFGHRSGISERTLWSKLAEAKRHLSSQGT